MVDGNEDPVVILLDGTWRNADRDKNDTNVGLMRKVVDVACYYDAGVGAKWYNKLRGGFSGEGLSEKIRDAYAAVAQRHDGPLFLFGYSRGAYTARSLAGLIALCGRPVGLGEEEAKLAATEAMKIYRNRQDREDQAARYRDRRETGSRREVEFVGVWDTVGALGVPWAPQPLAAYRFHDTRLSHHIQHGRHAVSIDERRRTFRPTLWTGRHADVRQCWFAGGHADIGGSKRPRATLALLWMLEEARNVGLPIKPDHYPRLGPDAPLAPITFGFRILPKLLRTIQGSGAQIHSSVRELMRDRRYTGTEALQRALEERVPWSDQAELGQ